MARNDLSNSDSVDEILEHPAPFYERVKVTVFPLKANWLRCLVIAG